MTASLHVHFDPNQASGSHRLPCEFRVTRDTTGSTVRTWIRDVVATANDAWHSDPVQRTLHQVASLVDPTHAVLRQEVPFERWFFHYGSQNDLSPIDKECSARLWAALSAAEGAIRTVAELVALVFTTVTNSNSKKNHCDALKVQCQGISLSLLATILPQQAAAFADDPSSAKPLVGTLVSDWSWGTAYTGTYNLPWWQLSFS